MLELKVTLDVTPAMAETISTLMSVARIANDLQAASTASEEPKEEAAPKAAPKNTKAKAAATAPVKEVVTAPVPAEAEAVAAPSPKEEKPEPKPMVTTIEAIRVLAAEKAKAGKRDAIKAKLVELGAQNITTLAKEKYGLFMVYLKTL